MTFVEVVLAAALLAVLAGGISAVFSFVVGVQTRERQRVMAMEVANRLIINFMDDSAKMPDQNKLLEYGPPDAPTKFRWRLRDDPVQVFEPQGDTRSTQSGLSLDRFRIVTVQVWLSEQSGGAERPDGTTPEATLQRMFDPIGMRNPDAISRMMTSDSGLRNLTSAISGATGQTRSGGVVPRRDRGQGVRPPGLFGQGGGRGQGGMLGRGGTNPFAAPGTGGGGPRSAPGVRFVPQQGGGR